MLPRLKKLQKNEFFTYNIYRKPFYVKINRKYSLNNKIIHRIFTKKIILRIL